MIIETYTYEIIDSKMYAVLENHSAILIDPCISSEACSLLKSRNVSEILIILTHEHYDHFSGIGMFRNEFKDCEVLCSAVCNEYLQRPSRNGSKFFLALFFDKEEKLEEAAKVGPVSYTADRTFSDQCSFCWQGHEIQLVETPGHTPGSICIIIDGNNLFSGDSLLKEIPVVFKLPGGSRAQYNEKTLPFLRELDENMRVFPGHGEGGLLEEFNITDV